MKKILVLLAVVAMSFTAKAGTVSINNTTGITFTLFHTQFLDPVAMTGFPMNGTTYSVSPGTHSWMNTSAMITALGGPMRPVVATEHVGDLCFSWAGGNCVICGGITPTGFYTATETCGGTTVTITFIISGPNNDVAITLS